MELYQLKSFVAVAEEENLTRAAERLFSSQPAVSGHIKALEEELGVALFDRTARGMALTRDGEALLEKARATLDQAAGMSQLARNLQAHPRGALRVGVAMDVGDLRLDEVSARLHGQHAGIQIEFAHCSSGAVANGLLNGDLDAGFMEGELETPRLEGILVGSNTIVVIGSPDHRAAFASGDWKALEALPWVFRTPECSYHRLMSQIAEAHGLALNKRFVIDHFETCLRFVRRGIAVSIANEASVSDELERGELIAWKGFRHDLPLRLACASKRADERAIRAFFEAVEHVLIRR